MKLTSQQRANNEVDQLRTSYKAMLDPIVLFQLLFTNIFFTEAEKSRLKAECDQTTYLILQASIFFHNI
jgi:hypothetical protein